MQRNTSDVKKLWEWNNELARLYIVNDVFLVVYLILGIIGNTIVIIVYRLKMKTKADDRFFIPYLAVIDLLACTTRSSFELAMNLLPVNFRGSTLCKALWFPTNVTAFCSMLLLLTISLQRYLKVCRPFGKQMTLKWKRIALGLTLMVSVLLAMPLNFWNEEIPVKNTERNITGFMCDARLEGNIGTVFIIYIVFITVLALMIMFGMIVFNSLIGRTIFIHLRQHRKKQKTLRKKGNNVLKTINSSRFRFLKNSDDPIASTSPINEEISAISVTTTTSLYDTSECGEEGKHLHTLQTKQTSSLSFGHLDSLNMSALPSDAVANDTVIEITTNNVCDKTENKGLKCKTKKEQNDNNKMPPSYKYSLMYMVIGIAFILSYLPQFILLFAGLGDPVFWVHRSNTELTIFSLIREMNVINNIVNPFVYGFFDRTFRKETKKLFKPLSLKF